MIDYFKAGHCKINFYIMKIPFQNTNPKYRLCPHLNHCVISITIQKSRLRCLIICCPVLLTAGSLMVSIKTFISSTKLFQNVRVTNKNVLKPVFVQRLNLHAAVELNKYDTQSNKICHVTLNSQSQFKLRLMWQHCHSTCMQDLFMCHVKFTFSVKYHVISNVKYYWSITL